MADDVRIATGLRNHRKTKRLKRQLGTEGCWALVCLFLWAGEERWTGDLSGLSDADIEDEAGWEGEPGEFVAALIAVRFMVGEAGTRSIHDWAEHNPYAASKGQRIEKGKRAASARWNPEASQEHARSMPGACSEDATTPIEQCPPAPAPTPAPSITPEGSSTPDAPAARVGVFEGHTDPQPAVIHPATKAAIELRKRGLQVTGQNPDLIAAVSEGVTVEHLLDALECNPGKPPKYVISHARREHASSPSEITGNARAGPNGQQVGKTMQGIQILQEMKRGLGTARDSDGFPEAALPRIGSSASG